MMWWWYFNAVRLPTTLASTSHLTGYSPSTP